MERWLQSIKQRFKHLFSVNPHWTSSVAAQGYRQPSPHDTGSYRPPIPDNADPKVYHYWTRDARRQPNITVEMVTLKEGELTVIPKPPTVKQVELREAPEQPPHDGYWPIKNVK